MTTEQERQLDSVLSDAGAYEVLHHVARWMGDRLAPVNESRGRADIAARVRDVAARVSELAHRLLV